ncbi:MAG: hypothetical protein ACK56I_12345, partial [bacterium]
VGRKDDRLENVHRQIRERGAVETLLLTRDDRILRDLTREGAGDLRVLVPFEQRQQRFELHRPHRGKQRRDLRRAFLRQRRMRDHLRRLTLRRRARARVREHLLRPRTRF